MSLDLDDPAAVVIAAVAAFDARTIVAALGARLDRALMDHEAALLATEIPDHDIAGRYRAVMAG